MPVIFLPISSWPKIGQEYGGQEYEYNLDSPILLVDLLGPNVVAGLTEEVQI